MCKIRLYFEEKVIKTSRTSYWSSELITLVCSLFFTLACNSSFWTELLQGKELANPYTWFIIFCTATAITGLQWFLLLLVINRWTFKWFTMGLLLVTSVAVYFMNTFHVYIDPTMITNVVSTDYQESSEFLQWRILPYFLFLGVLPCWMIWHIKIYKRSLPSYWAGRLGTIFLSLCMMFGGAWAIFHELGPIHRERKQIIYLITPLNIISSSTKAYWRARQARVDKTKIKIGTDAHKLPRPENSKPRVIILVVGETVRAGNWGLNGYHRQTTPELAKRQVINFSEVTSCGTTTAVSLPCMFSPYGMHEYNSAKIDQTESLLHLLERTNVSVLWRDNQSGCKGVCEDSMFEKLKKNALCQNKRCFDEVLLHQLQKRIINIKGDQLIILHMLGNHGPAYFERYPEQFKHWTPICETTDLSTCSQKALVNTYDNAILYTDSILAHAIDLLHNIKSHDTGLIYVSDHGESLGEHNLFLHGLPYFMAPDEQKKVPMIFWLSEGLSKQLVMKENCLHNKQSDPISHDYLFSTLLSLFDVKAKEYNPKFDLIHSCRM
ncbi:phosphoethanolamine--lipid A transferase [Legionella sp. PATHC038]|uniref:phosphoethanolamine transferase n=1 Tax=Legionella sheltonii TaxID=2992041 RepID=UPI002ADE3FA6|nr:phosphoethanolamine--lipid A transferase [Legionella sp. PATHC038]